jgi:hypothetical protein
MHARTENEWQLPPALASLEAQPRWVVWRYEQKPGSDKPTKVPYQARYPAMKASSTNPETWGTHAEAVETFERSRTGLRQTFDGVGFVLTDSEFAAFDIDNCRDKDTGIIHEKVWDLIRRCNSYTEITPSGTGLRIIGNYLDDPKPGKKDPMPGANGVSIEVYPARGRYITITGNHLEGTPETLADITGVINDTIAELDATTSSGEEDDDNNHEEDDATDDELPASLTVRLYIRDGGAGQPHAGYQTRSELMFAFITDALRARIANKRIAKACLDQAHRGHAIYEHCSNQQQSLAYVQRQIARARDMIKEGNDASIAKLNENHALVLAGNKASVMKFEKIDGRTRFRLLQIGAFKQWFANEHVTVGKKVMTIADYWLNHSQRRQYHGIEFAPAKARNDYYNLWREFTVQPREGDCTKFLAHLRDNVAQKNEDHYNWIVAWWAQIVQQPTEKPGTSLVIRGKPGTGKTKTGDVLGSLFGEHYELVADPRYITGQFNSHMASLLVLHADEAFWAGDKRAEGKLKDLITGRKHRLEFKGIDPILVDNHIRLFITANYDWVVPAAFEERRNAVFDISDAHLRDIDYFAAIDEEMNNGGREALLHHLLTFDLSKVNLRQIPRTEALLEQIVATATAEQSWWFDVLSSGTLPYGIDEPNICPKGTLYQRYIRHARLQGVSRRQIETTIGIFLKKVVGSELKNDEKKDYKVVDRHGRERVENGRVYRFLPLKACRERFAKAVGQQVSWNEPEAEWQHEQRSMAMDEEEM